MQVAPGTVVTIAYTVTDEDGDVLDRADAVDPLAYLHGTGSIVPGLEAALAGHESGEALEVTLDPDDAYGEHDPELVAVASRAQFDEPDALEVGMQFETEGDDGSDIVTVVAIDGDDVTLDANHPLAGYRLTFAVEILGVRAATAEELEHGHPHGVDGHEH
jgi:FKBP-type peptidyl-prolyl cis-trans isomerase SlyD